MKQLFLTSSVSEVANAIVKKFPNLKNKKVVFIMTASEAEEGDKEWLQKDKDALIFSGFQVTDYTLTNKTEADVKNDLNAYDIIFFSGGNTFYLLEKLQQSHSAKFFIEQINKGVIYIGSSAGSIIAGPDIELIKKIDLPKKAPNLQGFTGLGLVDFTVFPHWGNDHFRNLYLNKQLDHAYTMKNKIILLTDKQYIYAKDDLYRIEEI